jgi:dTDP-4-amino-4,6-dideoxygalactose transaminase
MEPLCRIAAAHDLMLFEDCAQAAGGSYKGRRLGTFGTFGAFGMNPFKVFTSGEGGALVTDTAPQIPAKPRAGICRVLPDQSRNSEFFTDDFRRGEMTSCRTHAGKP